MNTSKKSAVSYTQMLASFVANAKFEDLPDNVVYKSKQIMLDTIGCAIGGYSLTRGKIVLNLARELGGRPEATLFVTGDKVSCTNAAFANADLANALDADETFLNFTHFANTVLASALACSERIGASGKNLVVAFAVGFDIAARVGLSLLPFKIVGVPPNEKVEFVPNMGFGYACVGGTAAAGKALGLDNGEMADAFGLAGANAVSPSASKWAEGANTMQKYAGYGFMAHTGVLAALLAKKGYRGDRSILDGDLGFWRFSGSASVNWDILAEELGKKWWILEDSVKPYPSCRYTHQALDLFFQIMREQRIRPGEIESVTARVHPAAMSVQWLREPCLTPDPNDPTTPIRLQWNLPYLISLAALDTRPGPEWFSPDRLADTRLRDLMKKVRVEPEPAALTEVARAIREEPTKRFRRCPGSVTVVARGQTFEARSEYAMGDPWVAQTRISDDQLKDKFRRFCDGILSSAKIENAIESIYQLEKLDQTAKLVELLTA